MNSDRSRLLVRALGATLFAVIIAALSHGAGGASAPSLVVMFVATVLALPVVVLLQRVRAPLARQVLVIGLSQLAFHTLFWLSPVPGIVSNTSPSHHLTHLMLIVPASGTSTTASMDMGLSGGMTIAHVVAGVAPLALWRYGDALTRAIANTVIFSLRRLIALAHSIAPVSLTIDGLRLTSRPDHSGAIRHLLLQAGLRHRGPPLSLA